MDPRPYHFEYRRPRLSNPTYESQKLYASIYHRNSMRDIQQNLSRPQFFQPTAKTPRSQPSTMNRHQSTNLPHIEKASIRYDKSLKHAGSQLSHYGTSLMQGPLQQTQIYKKQQKTFNIINCTQKPYVPAIKKYPKFTLEDQLFERRGSLEKISS